MSRASAPGAVQSLLRREATLWVGNLGKALFPVIFFLIVGSLFPLAINPDPVFLARIAPGVIWIAALLSTLLALDGLYKSDFEDGTLDALFLSPSSILLVGLVKTLFHWLVTAIPLLLMTVLLSVMLYLPENARAALFWGLLLGTPLFSIIGSIGAALTVSLRNSGILLTLIVVPLYVPVLIFGTSAAQAAASGLDYASQLYLLGALLALGITLAPFAIVHALRINLN